MILKAELKLLLLVAAEDVPKILKRSAIVTKRPFDHFGFAHSTC
jgi:hypothetical protein